MQFLSKKVFFVAVLFGGVSSFGQTVEFLIKVGTQNSDWNTKEAIVNVQVGDTLKIVNQDSISHALHTDDAPFKHTKAIKPNSSVNIKVLAPYSSEKSGPLRDHESEASFWINSTAVVDAVSLSHLLNSYSSVQKPLVVDDLELVKSGAKSLKELTAKWLTENPSGTQVKTVTAINVNAEEIVAAEDLDEARIAFIKVSDAAIELIRSDSQLKLEWQLFFCPMVAKNRGYWVQTKGEKLANPYMGSQMPACGSKKTWE